jgi:hypothetical protein
MTERDQTPHGAPAAPDGAAATPPATDSIWREETTPDISPVGPDGATGGGSTAIGSGGHGYAGADENYYTAPQYSTAPVVVRRGDSFAALLLILAGLAAGVSLLLRWLPVDQSTGWDLVKRGFDDLGQGVSRPIHTGMWEPLAIVLGGGALFVLGLLLLIPAKAHRVLGLLALLVSLAVGAGVLVPLAKQNWRIADFRVGFFFAIAVGALGLLGSLKALLSRPKVGAPRMGG